jgi:hypothetical protein
MRPALTGKNMCILLKEQMRRKRRCVETESAFVASAQAQAPRFGTGTGICQQKLFHNSLGIFNSSSPLLSLNLLFAAQKPNRYTHSGTFVEAIFSRIPQKDSFDQSRNQVKRDKGCVTFLQRTY